MCQLKMCVEKPKEGGNTFSVCVFLDELRDGPRDELYDTCAVKNESGLF